MELPRQQSAPLDAPRRELGLFDSTCIIVGIIVAAGIYRSSPDVARLAPNAAALLGLWLLGGALSLLGALCYAELATAYPQEGGDYVYLTRAFGRRVGFLFAWCQLWIVRPGSIGVMAYAFADYANRIWPRAEGGRGAYVLVMYAAGSIIALTAVNILGVREGKWTQNVLTVAKMIGLTAIVTVGFLHAAPASPAAATALRILGPFLVRHGPGHDLCPVHLRRLERDGLRGRGSKGTAEEHPPRLADRHAGRNRDLCVGQPGLPAQSRPGGRAAGDRGGRRARVGHRAVGRREHEPLGLYFRPRRDQRPDLHRIENLFRHGPPAPALCLARTMEQPGAARRSARC